MKINPRQGLEIYDFIFSHRRGIINELPCNHEEIKITNKLSKFIQIYQLRIQMAQWHYGMHSVKCNPSFLTEASTVPPMTSACPQGLARGPVHCSCGPRSPWSPPSSAPLPERDDAEESATGIAASRVQSRGKMSSVRLKNVNTALTHLTVPY